MRDPNRTLPPHGLMFHHFYDDFHPAGQGAIDKSAFDNLIEFVGAPRILSAPEWFARHDARRLQPGDTCITFDDGLCCQYDVAAPVLKHYGIKAIFFVNTGALNGDAHRLEFYRYFRTVAFASVDDFYSTFMGALQNSPYAPRARAALEAFVPANYMSTCPFYTDADRVFRYLRDDVLGAVEYYSLMDGMIAARGYVCDETMRKRLWLSREQMIALHGEGHLIGLHSHTHPIVLKNLCVKDQESEYRTNQEILAALLGETPFCMSHPSNSYSETTLEILGRLGVRLGFRADMQNGYMSNLEYRREDHANLMKEMAREGSRIHR